MIGKAEACGLAIDRTCVSNALRFTNGLVQSHGARRLHPSYRAEDIESVADTVIEHMSNKSLGYEPMNVQDFLARKGNVDRVVTQVPGGQAAGAIKPR